MGHCPNIVQDTQRHAAVRGASRAGGPGCDLRLAETSRAPKGTVRMNRPAIP
jgi:hypothetical protein